MSKPEFVYVTYIRTTIDKLWDALRKPEFTKQYWYGMELRSEWTRGSAWSMVAADGRVFDSGEILESDPPRHLVIKWQHQLQDELRAEGFSRATFDLETVGETVKLTIVHSGAGPKFIEAVSSGWPRIIASLKTLLETGQPLPGTKELPR